MSKLTYNGLEKHKTVFTFDEVKEICPNLKEMPDAVNGFGLLQAEQHYSEVGAGRTMSFTFLHFTMQELLAAFLFLPFPVKSNQQQLRRHFGMNNILLCG